VCASRSAIGQERDGRDLLADYGTRANCATGSPPNPVNQRERVYGL
jgi:hypothetical protein